MSDTEAVLIGITLGLALFPVWFYLGLAVTYAVIAVLEYAFIDLPQSVYRGGARAYLNLRR